MGGGGEPEIMRWWSNEPFAISKDFSDISFSGKRQVLGSEDLRNRLNLGPATTYDTRFVFKRSWALTGIYDGPNGGSPGDLTFYAARGK
jgi:hypothetical protein